MNSWRTNPFANRIEQKALGPRKHDMVLFPNSPLTQDPRLRVGLRQRARRGLTLVELLVVMIILSLVTVATIPLMQPPSGERKIREAARNVATTFELARARATETGRPAGVWIEPQKKGPNNEVEAYKLFLCDVPPPYAGDTTTSSASVTNNGATVTLNGSSSATALVKYGDRIRLNFRGPWYRITGGADGNNITGGSLSIAINQAPDFAPPPAEGNNIPFEILRQPVKSSINPTILPTNAPASVVDLTQSGHGASNVEFGNNPNGKPVIITFTPTGRLHQVIHYQADGSMELEQPASMLYFLVRLRKEQGVNGYNVNEAFKDLDAYWVAINPFTGLVSVSSVVSGSTTVQASRSAATKGRIEGGN